MGVKAAVYARVSTTKDTQETSVPKIQFLR
jgi:hypothetical protein